jgi:hypothetical protein
MSFLLVAYRIHGADRQFIGYVGEILWLFRVSLVVLMYGGQFHFFRDVTSAELVTKTDVSC